MPRITYVATALPEHLVSQADLKRRCAKIYGGHPELARLMSVFDRAGVRQRHLTFPPDYYLEERTFDERNADYVEQATLLAEKAARYALRKSGTHPEEIDHLFLVTTTGLATPGLDALLAPRLGLKPFVRRSPLFGLGCAGGVAALARATEYLRAYPRHRAMVVAVELSGQVFSREALTPTDLVGAALFGDGAAAAILSGDDRKSGGPRVTGSRSFLFESTPDLMGWTFTSDGMRLVLSENIIKAVAEPLGQAVKDFIAGHGLSLSRIGRWVLHPGGPRVMEAYAGLFGVSGRALEPMRSSMARVGNLSSASVLFILSDVISTTSPGKGDHGLLLAVGPGLAAEMLLVGW